MDEDKKGIDKMNEILEDCKLIQKMEPSKFIEIYDMYNKQLTWFFAISAGTLLWLLGNFDKFTISDGSMPYKIIYMISITSVATSTFMLAGFQGLFFWNQKDIIRSSFKLNNLIEHIQKILPKLGHIQSSNSTLSNELSDIYNTLEKVEKEPGLLYELNFRLIEITFSKKNMIAPLFFYMIGVLLFSAYIIIFMSYYI